MTFSRSYALMRAMTYDAARGAWALLFILYEIGAPGWLIDPVLAAAALVLPTWWRVAHMLALYTVIANMRVFQWSVRDEGELHYLLSVGKAVLAGDALPLFRVGAG